MATVAAWEAAAAVVGAAGTAYAVTRPTPKLPTITQPTVPSIDSQAVAEAKRRSLLDQFSRRGRASTILTNQYTDTKLG